MHDMTQVLILIIEFSNMHVTIFMKVPIGAYGLNIGEQNDSCVIEIPTQPSSCTVSHSFR